ncbi:hypothetical protein BDV93DRAFT_561732 [Ceratobasidium sp. AG-I]|nr:hypothetical protein BDV93DRAFT_561732 [Ceratobasidium sp. AG-I]
MHEEKDNNGSPNFGSADPRVHLKEFFARYSEFDYQEFKPYVGEFLRMRDHFQWGRRGKRYKSAKKAFREATLEQFNNIYGMDNKDMATLKTLFATIEAADMPEDAKACKKLLRSKYYVNICDLVDKPVTGLKITCFPDEPTLAEYTRTNEKIFPGPGKIGSRLINLLRRNIMKPKTE